MCAGAVTVAAAAEFDLGRSQGVRNRRHKGVMEGARIVALDALDRLKCVAPFVHAKLRALGVVPNTSTFVRFEALEGDAEGALHCDLELLGLQEDEVVRGPQDELSDAQIAVAGEVGHAALVVEW